MRVLIRRAQVRRDDTLVLGSLRRDLAAKRLCANGVAAEGLGLADAVNRLFGRVREGSLALPAFLAAAAHQLRPPLASLKNGAELALA